MRVIDRGAYEGLLGDLRDRGYEVVLPPGGGHSLLADRVDGSGDPVAMLTTGRRSDPARTLPPKAFVGLRSCELHAVRAMDAILLAGNAYDADYALARRRALMIGVNCREPEDTCYCGAIGAGPRCTAGFDLALTEVPYGYLAEAGSEAGQALLLSVTSREATAEEVMAVDRFESEARRHLRWSMDVPASPPGPLVERDPDGTPEA